MTVACLPPCPSPPPSLAPGTCALNPVRISVVGVMDHTHRGDRVPLLHTPRNATLIVPILFELSEWGLFHANGNVWCVADSESE